MAARVAMDGSCSETARLSPGRGCKRSGEHARTAPPPLTRFPKCRPVPEAWDNTPALILWLIVRVDFTVVLRMSKGRLWLLFLLSPIVLSAIAQAAPDSVRPNAAQEERADGFSVH